MAVYEPVHSSFKTCGTLEKSDYFELEATLPTINSSSHYETPHLFSELSSTQLYETCADIQEKETQVHEEYCFKQ